MGNVFQQFGEEPMSTTMEVHCDEGRTRPIQVRLRKGMKYLDQQIITISDNYDAKFAKWSEISYNDAFQTSHLPISSTLTPSEHSSSQYTGDSHDQEDGFEKETIFESETAMIIRFSSQEPRCDFMLLLIID